MYNIGLIINKTVKILEYEKKIDGSWNKKKLF